MYTHGSIARRSRLSPFSRLATLVAIGCGLVSTLPSVGAAQQLASRGSQLDARWQPWVGCWRPAAPQTPGMTFSLPRNVDAPLVCIIPATEAAATSSVYVLTVAHDTIAARDTITATGRNVARTKDSCTGVEDGTWSADGRRLYLTSDFTCPGGLKRTTSGLFAMSPRGDWVNVQGVNAGGNMAVHTLHYTDAGIPSTLPREISDALHAGGIASGTARAAAATRLTNANVIEASHKLDSVVVAAWIVDRGQAFPVDARQIVALADAGVPGDVTDAMVAVTYPKAFAVNNPADESGLVDIEQTQGNSASATDGYNRNDARVMLLPSYSRYDYSPFGYSPYDYYGYGYSPYGNYSPFGYAPYGYAPYGGGYYSPYSRYGAAYGGWYSPPIIVLRGSGTPQPAGRAIKGRGYTQTPPERGTSSGSNGSTASPRPVYSPPPPQPASQPADPPRTAHKRP
ncbi:MAG TPA: hypothetical protein VIC03_13985 [Gemmatimonadaceae bacterium]|jgi:hypothetical protein